MGDERFDIFSSLCNISKLPQCTIISCIITFFISCTILKMHKKDICSYTLINLIYIMSHADLSTYYHSSNNMVNKNGNKVYKIEADR